MSNYIENSELNSKSGAVSPRQDVLPNGDELNNQFMTLLVAQIQNQDPLNPMDGTEFVSQMAQLSQVQSTENMAKMLKSNTVQMERMQSIATANLVGQQVMVESDDVELDTQIQNGRLTLQHAASPLVIHLTDDLGQEHRINLGEQSAGSIDFAIDPTKQNLKPGHYKLSAVSSSAEKFIPLELVGVVNNVRIPQRGGAAQLNIAGIGDVPYHKIKQFGA
ncbi:flagellar hook assembly protein FlgD [Yersinia kristensenii]|uniref:Basal-body rod modification protein FlgD n=1 Tax=Yersinia kristensenii TaxID=28152 RepID=A0AB73NVQ9_YERKR|nr:flagellar hook assembly protein FlgD [Yersinia kristensenii]OVZ78883.1 flagellar basal body rod modification protein [Yersinia kristensenii]CNG87668.1 basal-body rod modification protein [Yersinia kristensenii]CNK42295.1 basal-body rod modification protein [Yersinia kristensenii]